MNSNLELNQELKVFFIDFLKDKSHKSESAIKKISNDLDKFISSLDGKEINADSISDYVFRIKDEYNHSSFKVKLSSVRQFTSWLDLKGNPFKYLNQFELEENEQEINYYSQAELEEFLKTASYFEKLLIKVIYELYLSVNEFYSIELADYNFANNSYRIRGIAIQVSDELAKQSKEFFKSLSNKPLDYQVFSLSPLNQEKISLAKIFKANQLSIKKLRRSRVMNLLNEPKSIDNINELLGIKLGNNYEKHEKVSKDYTLLKEFKNFHPRA
ncbi:MAG: hypothetical protein MK033_00060 [Candidatus Caenarcaniphilales bacterium]|nr:hypothetical protein [Candidatus Caenarcaniphilales bacterium]